MNIKYNGYSYPVKLDKKYSHSLVEFTSRKTKDYGLSSTLPGMGHKPDTRIALCLPEDDPRGRPFWSRIPVSQVYVKKYRQDKPPHELDPANDFRNVSVDLWNQMVKNNDLHGRFQPTFVILNEAGELNLEDFCV